MNPNLSRIEPSLIRSINAKKRAGDIDLGLGEPTIAPDLHPFTAALEWTRLNGSPYSPNAGFPELREAIRDYLLRTSWRGSHDHDVDVCVTVGSEEALYLAIKATIDPGRDEVLIVEPCYLAYAKICVMEGIRHRMVPLEAASGFRPDASRLLEAVRAETRLIVLNSPGNPTGRVWPEMELRALASGLQAAGRSDILILSDEVYRELYYGPEPPTSPAAYHTNTLVAGSLSKSCALTGLRLGWLAGPRDLIADAVKAHQFVNTAASTFSQRVAIEIFAAPGRIAAHREVYLAARQRLLEAADRLRLPLLPVEGAFYAFLKISSDAARDSVVTAERLLEEQRVVTVPGRAFGTSGEGWLRLSWVAPVPALAEGLGRIADWLRESV